MRVTSSMALRTTLRDLTRSLDRLQTSQRRLSSGKAHERMSDDPRTATDVMWLRGQIQRHDQMARTTDDTRARLQIADTALLGASDSLVRAKSLVVQASNSGISENGGQVIAQEIRLLREELLGAANTTYLGRSLFAGTQAGPAYDATSGAYLGNDVVEARTVSEQVRVGGNVTGEQAFGVQSSPEGDLFAVMDRLATAIESGDPAAIAIEHAHLDAAHDRVGYALAEVGQRVAQLDQVEAQALMRRHRLNERLAMIEDVDLSQAVIDMKSQETAYQAALSAAAKSMPHSLAQYLR